MAFALSKQPTFKFKVKVRQPNDKGEFATFEFLGEFNRLEQTRLEQLFREMPGDDALLEEVFVAWSGVKDADKNDLVVTPENRAALLVEPGVKPAIVRAWMEAAIAGPAKN